MIFDLFNELTMPTAVGRGARPQSLVLPSVEPATTRRRAGYGAGGRSSNNGAHPSFVFEAPELMNAAHSQRTERIQHRPRRGAVASRSTHAPRRRAGRPSSTRSRAVGSRSAWRVTAVASGRRSASTRKAPSRREKRRLHGDGVDATRIADASPTDGDNDRHPGPKPVQVTQPTAVADGLDPELRSPASSPGDMCRDPAVAHVGAHGDCWRSTEAAWRSRRYGGRVVKAQGRVHVVFCAERKTPP